MGFEVGKRLVEIALSEAVVKSASAASRLPLAL